MIYDDMTQEEVDSLLNGDFSCETTDDLYGPNDDELLYPSRHYDWVHICYQKKEKNDDWKCVNGQWIPF